MRLLILVLAIGLAGCSGVQEANEELLSIAVKKYTQQNDPNYKAAFVDLNNDNVQDAVVLLQEMGWCGSGGCTMLVMKGHQDGYQFVSKSTVTSTPIYTCSIHDKNWKRLAVYSAGQERIMQFDGNGYPLNPSMEKESNQTNCGATKILMADN